MLPSIFPNRRALRTGVAVFASAMVLAACTSTPEPNSRLEEVRSHYRMLEAQPNAQRHAQLELDNAEQRLQRAEQAWQQNAESARLEHLIYLAGQQVNIAEQTLKLRQAEEELANAGQARTQVQLQAREAQARAAEQRALSAEQRAQQLETELQELQAKSTERGSVVTLGDVLFDVDRAELKEGGRRSVAQLAEFLRDNPERKVLIEGFTDSTGADAYNQQLSERRARSVGEALTQMGVDRNRIETRGYGEAYPVASNDSAGSRQLNRRVEVIISDDDQPVQQRR